MKLGNIVLSKFYKYIEIFEDHFHKPQLIYPFQADPVTLSATASAWGGFYASQIVEIMSAGDAPTNQFDLHWAILSGISANGIYDIKLYKGAAGSEVEIARLTTARNAVQSAEGSIPVQTEILPGSTRISAALSSDNAVADTLDIKIGYHEY